MVTCGRVVYNSNLDYEYLLFHSSTERITIHKLAFPELSVHPLHVHLSDLTALYGQLIGSILQNEKPPSGEEGYYFSNAYQVSSQEFANHPAEALHTRGLRQSQSGGLAARRGCRRRARCACEVRGVSLEIWVCSAASSEMIILIRPVMMPPQVA